MSYRRCWDRSWWPYGQRDLLTSRLASAVDPLSSAIGGGQCRGGAITLRPAASGQRESADHHIDADSRSHTDVGVAGCDDSSWATRTQPPLSTVHQPAREFGRDAAELVHCRLLGEHDLPRSVMLTPRSSGGTPSEPPGSAHRRPSRPLATNDA
ncbi:substrate-binding domain-containing protein [Catellatospora coxensis]|uniref:substrate-binding domain-containing protein n=1 Tax=Catellatospora coxensis TaxID=310354 RepID=UPI001EF21ABF|nr:substrate-binding domain-containing protein [Catellatospora coxensis]